MNQGYAYVNRIAEIAKVRNPTFAVFASSVRIGNYPDYGQFAEIQGET